MSVTINQDQGLYVIPKHGGYSCLGFDVLIERYNRLAVEVGWRGFPADERGTLAGFARYTALMTHAASMGSRFACELTPQLAGLEGRRVEVTDLYGETHRFQVGKSTGWLPIHLELSNSRSTGGIGAGRAYASVRVIR